MCLEVIELEVRNTVSNQEGFRDRNTLIFGTKGWMQMVDSEFRTFLGPSRELGPSLHLKEQPVEERLACQSLHFRNFISCVRSRKWQELNADVAEGHLSSTIAHLGNIAYKTGRKLQFNPYSEKFVNDLDTDSYLSRYYQHPFVLPEIG